MAYIAKERAEVEKGVIGVQKKLSRLIDFVSENLPPDAEEFLYKESFNVEGDEDFPKAKYREAYVLTRSGLKEVIKGIPKKDMPKLGTGNMDAFDVVASVNLNTFNKICMNLQAIIDKHEIEIPKEYL